jgi:hypothetical protein
LLLFLGDLFNFSKLISSQNQNHINNFLTSNNIKREKHLKGSVFLKFFDIFFNKPSMCRQRFAVEVTKLMSPDEIRRVDGVCKNLRLIITLYKTLMKHFQNN